jgi:hypothetical protein
MVIRQTVFKSMRTDVINQRPIDGLGDICLKISTYFYHATTRIKTSRLNLDEQKDQFVFIELENTK